eukprot:Skav233501  [mRNA]  locus=scaffold2687:190729:191241:- [translate_table: standard]
MGSCRRIGLGGGGTRKYADGSFDRTRRKFDKKGKDKSKHSRAVHAGVCLGRRGGGNGSRGGGESGRDSGAGLNPRSAVWTVDDSSGRVWCARNVQKHPGDGRAYGNRRNLHFISDRARQGIFDVVHGAVEELVQCRCAEAAAEHRSAPQEEGWVAVVPNCLPYCSYHHRS